MAKNFSLNQMYNSTSKLSNNYGNQRANSETFNYTSYSGNKMNNLNSNQDLNELYDSFSFQNPEILPKDLNISTTMESETSNLSEISSTETNVASNFFKIDMPSMVLGSALTGLNSSINSTQNSSLMNASKSGNSQFGHNFYADNMNQAIVNHNNLFTDLENTAITIGSFFGPEGVIAGGLAAAGISLAGHFIQPDMPTVNSTSGAQVDPTT